MENFALTFLRNPEAIANDKYPVPFVFQHTEAARLQWSVKLSNYTVSQTQKIETLKKSLNRIELSALTKNRLERQLAAETQSLQQFKGLIDPFEFSSNSNQTQSSLHHRIPSRQHFGSYYQNIFRDWVWGDEENKIYGDLLKKLTLNEGTALIIGGGAGKLLYDLRKLKPKLQIIQIDINPLLSVIGQKINF